MVLSFIQKTVLAKQKHATLHNILSKTAFLIGIFISMLSLSACQTSPNMPTSSTVPTVTNTSTPNTVKETVTPDNNNDQHNYPIEVYIPTEQPTTTPSYPTQPVTPPVASTSANNPNQHNPLTKQTNTQSTTEQLPDIFSNNTSSVVIPIPDTTISVPSPDDYMISPPATPSRNELLKRARQNSQQRSQQATSDNSELPAFRNLMQAGTSQLKAGNLTAAENSFTRAQRIAPQSSAVYFYLAQVALKKDQPRKAEAMARRGLSVSQEAGRRRALWQIILQAGKLQNNSRVVREANQALR